MKIKYLIPSLFLFSAFSCATTYGISGVQPEKNKAITSDLPADQRIAAVIKPYSTELESKMNTVIAHTGVDLTKNGDNSNLGNLLADFTFTGAESWAKSHQIPQIDAAVINIGGIRSTIGKGDILTKHVYEVMPFENEIVVVKMKGSDLQGLFDYYAKTQKNNPVSHLLIETDQNAVSRQLINGEPLKADRDYYIATSDYLALGGDNMNFFSKGEMLETGIKMRDLFLEKFREQPQVSAPDDVRLIFKNKKVENDE